MFEKKFNPDLLAPSSSSSSSSSTSSRPRFLLSFPFFISYTREVAGKLLHLLNEMGRGGRIESKTKQKEFFLVLKE